MKYLVPTFLIVWCVPNLVHAQAVANATIHGDVVT